MTNSRTTKQNEPETDDSTIKSMNNSQVGIIGSPKTTKVVSVELDQLQWIEEHQICFFYKLHLWASNFLLEEQGFLLKDYSA